MSAGRTLRWIAPLLAAILLSGCGGVSLPGGSSRSCVAPTSSAALAEVDGIYILPDDGRTPILDEISHAICTIDVATYLISDDEVIDALIAAEARGVEVRLIHEPTPFGGGTGSVEISEELQRAGVEVRTGPTDITFMHAKYMVFDDQVGIVTNQNLTYSAFESNREVGVLTTHRDDVAGLGAIFEADWTGTPLPAPSGRLIVSPLNSRAHLLEIIDGAGRSIDLYAEVVRDDQIIDALSSAVQRGVAVRLIVNRPEGDLDETVYNVLAANGVQIRVASGLYIHSKALVVDGHVVVVGSQNPTATSLDENREVSLVLDDRSAALRVNSVFDRDWQRGAPYAG